VTVLVDPPTWAAHGRWWSHLASDASDAELHAFAVRVGVPRRAFDRDHYDVPAEAYAAVVAAGADPVSSRELVARLSAAGLRRRRATAPGRRRPGQLLLRPRRLRPGDAAAVVAASGPVLPERLERGLDVLRGWGLRVRLLPHVLGRHRQLAHLAGTDAERASDLQAAWTDPATAVVWCARGGYGAHRVVDLLDWTAMAAAGPRLLVGFSDVTALHEAVAGRLGTVSVHGPVVTSLGDAPDACRAGVRSLLFDPDGVRDLFAGVALRRLVGGSGAGVLTGGNLRVLTASAGTALRRSAGGGIAVLEDVGEPAYRVDAMLTQLLRTGWFDGVRGIVAGAFTAGDVPDGEPGGPDRCGGSGWSGEAVQGVLRDRLGDLGVPVVAGAPVGHVPDNRPVPLGVEAVLDADAGTLRLRGPALA